jgi:Big-like domain-containing protein
MLRRTAVGLFLLGLLLAITPGVMQDAATCTPLVEAALKEADKNCDAQSLDRNSACYGYKQVEATFSQIMPDNFFTKPSDRAALTAMQSIHTSAADTKKQIWGVALLRVLASNIPDTLPGQALTFLLMGDTELENAVPADKAYQPAQSINVIVRGGTNFRSAPSANANVTTSIAEDATLPIDALSPDQQWVRAVFNKAPGWVNRDRLGANTGVDGLPVIHDYDRVPMQAFYIRTRGANLECSQAPNTLVLQGAENVAVDLTANGAYIRIGSGSTVALNTPADNQLQLTALHGSASVEGVTVNAGFTIQAPLSDDGKAVDGHWTGLHPLGTTELASLQVVEPDLALLPVPVTVPSESEIQQTVERLSPTEVPTAVVSNTNQGQPPSGGSGGGTGPPAPTAVTSNNPPVAISDVYTTAMNTALNIGAPGILANDSDPDGNPITAVLVGSPSHGGMTMSGNGSFTYTPSAGYTGTDSFTYFASDGMAGSNTATVTINVI